MNERLYGEGMALLNDVCVVMLELKHETAYVTEHAPLSLAGCLYNGHGSECSLTHTSPSLLVQSPQPVGVPLGTSLALSDNLRPSCCPSWDIGLQTLGMDTGLDG